jgi:hypothetical protein
VCILRINFRVNLNARNAGNGISGLQISNIFWGNMPPNPVAFSHSYPPLIYYLTEGYLFKKCPLPRGKILKKALTSIPKKLLNVCLHIKFILLTTTPHVVQSHMR